MTELTNDIEDALVAWWQARNALEAAGGRLMPGAQSLEFIRAQRAEQAARDTLHRAMERLLTQLSSMRQWPALDGFNLLRAAGQFSEEPPEPPKQASGKCG
jgi:hypothetical protein